MRDTETPTLQIDIISDVMCPWCIVGFKQLELALGRSGAGARLRWHPFELNPDMGPDGENLADHIRRKYGSSPEDSARARDRLTEIGEQLGFDFRFTSDMRIVNSFAAHVLLDWAATKGRQHPLKLALFRAHFGEGRDVSCPATLADIAAGVGLDRDEAAAALDSPAHRQAVRAEEKVWRDAGISGVPTMIFAEKYMVTGAQGADAYGQIIARSLRDTA